MNPHQVSIDILENDSIFEDVGDEGRDIAAVRQVGYEGSEHGEQMPRCEWAASSSSRLRRPALGRQEYRLWPCPGR
ncbi:hypothetical protein V501_00733 [Pseudogymnoascus sp. VKM F-4519 (FW-2642)]|nr:hypothetical protein V501_00733 [Pseudogymnoascus sp. VKM F-4519 (FW-2642)]